MKGSILWLPFFATGIWCNVRWLVSLGCWNTAFIVGLHCRVHLQHIFIWTEEKQIASFPWLSGIMNTLRTEFPFVFFKEEEKRTLFWWFASSPWNSGQVNLVISHQASLFERTPQRGGGRWGTPYFKWQGWSKDFLGVRNSRVRGFFEVENFGKYFFGLLDLSRDVFAYSKQPADSW